jgi:ABC-type antimicrobial peptide transport system permease subunit
LADVFVLGLQSIGGFVLTSKLPYLAMSYSFVATFAVALAAAWYPALRASQMNIITAINHE